MSLCEFKYSNSNPLTCRCLSSPLSPLLPLAADFLHDYSSEHRCQPSVSIRLSSIPQTQSCRTTIWTQSSPRIRLCPDRFKSTCCNSDSSMINTRATKTSVLRVRTDSNAMLSEHRVIDSHVLTHLSLLVISLACFAQLTARSRLSLPFWLYRAFASRNFASIFAPAFCTPKYRDQIMADAVRQNLARAQHYFYELGQQIAIQIQNPELLDTLSRALDARYHAILALNSLTPDQTYTAMQQQNNANGGANGSSIASMCRAMSELHSSNLHNESTQIKKYDANHLIHRLCCAEKRLLDARIVGVTEYDAHVRRKTGRHVQSLQVRSLYAEQQQSKQLAQQEAEADSRQRFSAQQGRQALAPLGTNTGGSTLQRSSTSAASSLQRGKSGFTSLTSHKSNAFTRNNSSSAGLQRSKSNVYSRSRSGMGQENELQQGSKRSRYA